MRRGPRWTCPGIDTAIACVRDVIAELESVDRDEDPVDVAQSALRALSGKFGLESLLEDVRQENIGMREYAESKDEEIAAADTRIAELEEYISELEWAAQ